MDYFSKPHTEQFPEFLQTDAYNRGAGLSVVGGAMVLKIIENAVGAPLPYWVIGGLAATMVFVSRHRRQILESAHVAQQRIETEMQAWRGLTHGAIVCGVLAMAVQTNCMDMPRKIAAEAAEAKKEILSHLAAIERPANYIYSGPGQPNSYTRN